MWLIVLKRFWPFIVGALALLALYAWHAVQVTQALRAGYEQAQQEFTVQLERERQLWQQIEQETRDGYESQISQLRQSASRERRGPAIRCVLDGKSQVRTSADSSGVASGAAGRSDVRTAADLRSDIVQRGESCEQLRQQLISIKAWQAMVR